MTTNITIFWGFLLEDGDIDDINTDALVAQFKMVNPDACFYFDYDPEDPEIAGRLDTAVELEDLNPLALLFEDQNIYPFYCKVDTVILKNIEGDLSYEILGTIDCEKLPKEVLFSS